MTNPNPDRKTGIRADQIADNTLTPYEFESENGFEDFTGEIVLVVNPTTKKFKFAKKELIASVQDYFQYDINNDIELISIPIFTSNDKGDVTLTEDGTDDFFFEIVDNEVTPKM